jgi:hypothetical protein
MGLQGVGGTLQQHLHKILDLVMLVRLAMRHQKIQMLIMFMALYLASILPLMFKGG